MVKAIGRSGSGTHGEKMSRLETLPSFQACTNFVSPFSNDVMLSSIPTEPQLDVCCTSALVIALDAHTFREVTWGLGLESASYVFRTARSIRNHDQKRYQTAETSATCRREC